MQHQRLKSEVGKSPSQSSFYQKLCLHSKNKAYILSFTVNQYSKISRGCSLDRYDDGLQKATNGFADHARGMKKFWSGHRETRRNSQALSPGKGRRFKSGQPHQKPCSTTINAVFCVSVKLNKLNEAEA
jgi:hypothetical protein